MPKRKGATWKRRQLLNYDFNINVGSRARRQEGGSHIDTSYARTGDSTVRQYGATYDLLCKHSYIQLCDRYALVVLTEVLTTVVLTSNVQL